MDGDRLRDVAVTLLVAAVEPDAVVSSSTLAVAGGAEDDQVHVPRNRRD